MKTETAKKRGWWRAVPAFLALLLFCPNGTAVAHDGEKGEKEPERQEGSEKAGKTAERDEGDETKLRIEVTAGEKDQPVDNASIYVKYSRERTLRKDEKVEMNTKTNRSGVAIVGGVPRGKVLVQVVAQGWKTFGQWYDLDKSEQTIKIKLVRPPRWY